MAIQMGGDKVAADRMGKATQQRDFRCPCDDR